MLAGAGRPFLSILLFPIITDDDKKTGFSYRFMHEIGLWDELMLLLSHCTCTQEFKNTSNGEGYWKANTLANLILSVTTHTVDNSPLRDHVHVFGHFAGALELGAGCGNFASCILRTREHRTQKYNHSDRA